MVNFCGVFACAKRGDKDRHLSFFRLPKIRLTEGEQTRQLSEQRQRAWLSNIGRSDIKVSNYPYTRVCSLHFVTGKYPMSYKYNLAKLCHLHFLDLCNLQLCQGPC